LERLPEHSLHPSVISGSIGRRQPAPPKACRPKPIAQSSNCHPFFTGRQKLIDTEGRVERFTKKFGVQTSESRKQAAKAKSKKEKAAASAR